MSAADDLESRAEQTAREAIDLFLDFKDLHDMNSRVIRHGNSADDPTTRAMIKALGTGADYDTMLVNATPGRKLVLQCKHCHREHIKKTRRRNLGEDWTGDLDEYIRQHCRDEKGHANKCVNCRLVIYGGTRFIGLSRSAIDKDVARVVALGIFVRVSEKRPRNGYGDFDPGRFTAPVYKYRPGITVVNGKPAHFDFADEDMFDHDEQPNDRTCAECGKSIMHMTARSQFCGTTCRKRASRKPVTEKCDGEAGDVTQKCDGSTHGSTHGSMHGSPHGSVDPTRSSTSPRSSTPATSGTTSQDHFGRFSHQCSSPQGEGSGEGDGDSPAEEESGYGSRRSAAEGEGFRSEEGGPSAEVDDGELPGSRTTRRGIASRPRDEEASAEGAIPAEDDMWDLFAVACQFAETYMRRSRISIRHKDGPGNGQTVEQFAAGFGSDRKMVLATMRNIIFNEWEIEDEDLADKWLDRLEALEAKHLAASQKRATNRRAA